MITYDIPGIENIKIKNIIFDYNGTIAEDGNLIEGVKDKIVELSKRKVDVYVVTSDTNGSVKKQCEGLPVNIIIFDKENASEDKKKIAQRLGSKNTISIGNGKNDLKMFENSSISIAIIGKEGCFTKTLFESDIVVNSIIDAIDLLLEPNRIRATLRT